MELSDEEKQRRELILEREFVDSDKEKELLVKVIYQLRELPVIFFVGPLPVEFTGEEKTKLYNTITESSFYKTQTDFVRAWIQIRFQDLLERGHLPSDIEILCLNEIFGAEFAFKIIKFVLNFGKELDKKEMKLVSQPKNEIEKIIFDYLRKRYRKLWKETKKWYRDSFFEGDKR